MLKGHNTKITNYKWWYTNMGYIFIIIILFSKVEPDEIDEKIPSKTDLIPNVIANIKSLINKVGLNILFIIDRT